MLLLTGCGEKAAMQGAVSGSEGTSAAETLPPAEAPKDSEDLTDPDVQSFYEADNIIEEFSIEYGEDQVLVID